VALAKSANGNLSQFESEETNGRFPTPAETLQLALGNGRKGASPDQSGVLGEGRLRVDLTHSTRVGRRAAAARKGDTKLSSRAQWFAMLGGEENSPQTRHRLIRAGSDYGGFLRVWKD